MSHFSVANRSHELLLQPVTKEGAHSITGEYGCYVTARNSNSQYIDRKIFIQYNGETYTGCTCNSGRVLKCIRLL